MPARNSDDEIIRELSKRFPALCKSLVEFIREELRLVPEQNSELLDLPKLPRYESEEQRSLRTSRVQGWIEKLNNSGTDFEGHDPEVILNKLLYEVYHSQGKKLFWEPELEKRIASQGKRTASQVKPKKRRAPDQEDQPRKRQATALAALGDAPNILMHLLEKLHTQHPEYAPVLASGLDVVGDKVMDFIRPEVKRLLSEGTPLTIDDLMSLGGDVSSKDAGVYVHIIREEPTSFYLYVGQAQVLERRIRNHQNPDYRRHNPCLHYHVLDSSPTMQSSFVVITCGQPEPTERRSYLNIIEMFTCLLFQTLPEKTLRKYLPGTVKIVNPGAHLNVAAPIYQGISNPGWSLLLVRDSSNPLIFDYYKRRMGIRAQQRREDQLELTRNGGLRHLSSYNPRHPNRRTFSIGCLNITIHIAAADTMKYGLMCGEQVFTEFLVTAGRNPDAWALDALDEDPGNRIAIRVSGLSPEDEPYSFYVHKAADNTAKQANTLFDFIDGVKDTVDSIKTPRRFFTKNRTLGRYENRLYT